MYLSGVTIKSPWYRRKKLGDGVMEVVAETTPSLWLTLFTPFLAYHSIQYTALI